MISIHAPLTGSDLQRPKRPAKNRHFNPRSPYGERPGINVDFNGNRLFQSTLPLRGATQIVRQQGQQAQFQSTLPLRGATYFRAAAVPQLRPFQSTLPLRGATPVLWLIRMRDLYFNPRSPYGERLQNHLRRPLAKQFQSTLPLRGATLSRSITTVVIPISIHAPLTGSDWSDFRASPNRPDFNPRSPYGERPCLRKPYCDGFSISIHAPLTGSDKEKFAESQTEIISIHAPLTGSDFALCCFSFKFADFNPRSPYGERPRHFRSFP